LLLLLPSLPCLCSHSPALVHVHLLSFTHSRSPAPIRPFSFSFTVRPLSFSFTRSRSRSPALPHSRLVCACLVICSFSLHVAGVRTRLCPLGCVSVCADPRYLVALIWPSFGLRLRSSPIVCACPPLVCAHPRTFALVALVCLSPFVPTRLCARLCSSPFVPATWCPQPLVCVCIK
jgi:hypothetical protein